jgi:transposase-like protein
MTTSNDIEHHVRAQKLSGKSASAYCREQGIPAGTFYDWRRRSQRISDRPSGFARVQTSITVQIEIGAAKLQVPLEALNAVLSEINKR